MRAFLAEDLKKLNPRQLEGYMTARTALDNFDAGVKSTDGLTVRQIRELVETIEDLLKYVA